MRQTHSFCAYLQFFIISIYFSLHIGITHYITYNWHPLLSYILPSSRHLSYRFLPNHHHFIWPYSVNCSILHLYFTMHRVSYDCKFFGTEKYFLDVLSLASSASNLDHTQKAAYCNSITSSLYQQNFST